MEKLGTLLIKLAISLPDYRGREVVVFRQYGITKEQADKRATEFCTVNTHLNKASRSMRAEWQPESETVELSFPPNSQVKY